MRLDVVGWGWPVTEGPSSTVASPRGNSVASSLTEDGDDPPVGAPGAMVGSSASVGGVAASPAVARSATGLVSVAAARWSSRSSSFQLGPQCATAFVWHLDQVVLDSRLKRVVPVGFEQAADCVDPPGQLDIQAVEIVTGMLAHFLNLLVSGSILDPRFMGCLARLERPRRNQRTTYFEEEVCLVSRLSDGDFVAHLHVNVPYHCSRRDSQDCHRLTTRLGPIRT